ncbi:MAG TPA: HAMP domain-containing sensor histidine kinase [Candidatus Binatia bacterium]|nr:HAMP domain-containing sensor histidine kinase [Candidatus Binatia bacterium]
MERPAGDPYRLERRRQVRERLRLAAFLALVPLGASATFDALIFRDRPPGHLALTLLQAACCALGGLLTFHRRAERSAIPLAVAIVIALVSAQLRVAALWAGDVEALICAMIATMAAVALIFPWGPGAQTLVSLYVAAGYLAVPAWNRLGGRDVADLFTGAALGIATAVVGALLLDRQHRAVDCRRRATALERERVEAAAHQSELLLEAGRELNATVDLAQLVKLVSRLGHRLVPCDVTALAVHDKRRRVFRTIAASSTRGDDWEGARGFELPADLFVTDELARRRVLEVSGNAPERLAQAAARYGMGRMLLAAIQRDGQLLGVLAFLQHTADPGFGEGSLRLAEGIAHQAAIALANARLFEELQSASKVKSDFVSTMSHELRTPLNIILGFAEMARDPAVVESLRGECLGKIDTAARDLLDLVDSTLAIGRIENGRDEVRLEPIAPRELWAELGAFCARLPRKPGVRLEWDRDVPPGLILTDPRKLTVIVRNLVGNALKFTEHGRVQAWVTVKGKQIVFAVSDTGIGIPRESQAHIFEMFRQADGSDSRRFGGSGLGLYIVSQYARQLDGTVEVESAPGRGSTFRVTLPLRVASRPARAA